MSCWAECPNHSCQDDIIFTTPVLYLIEICFVQHLMEVIWNLKKNCIVQQISFEFAQVNPIYPSSINWKGVFTVHTIFALRSYRRCLNSLYNTKLPPQKNPVEATQGTEVSTSSSPSSFSVVALRVQWHQGQMFPDHWPLSFGVTSVG